MTSDARVRLTVRINKSLDKKLSSSSKRLGISKNAYILMLLTNAVETAKQA